MPEEDVPVLLDHLPQEPSPLHPGRGQRDVDAAVRVVGGGALHRAQLPRRQAGPARGLGEEEAVRTGLCTDGQEQR